MPDLFSPYFSTSANKQTNGDSHIFALTRTVNVAKPTHTVSASEAFLTNCFLLDRMWERLLRCVNLKVKSDCVRCLHMSNGAVREYG